MANISEILNMSKEEAEPLLLQADSSDGYDFMTRRLYFILQKYKNSIHKINLISSHGMSETEEPPFRKGGKGKSTIISLQKPVAEHDYSITGEHYDPLLERDIEHPTS